MDKTIFATSLAAAALALGAAPAYADEPQYGCRMQEAFPGTGTIEGYVFHPADWVSIRCYVTVNGSEAWSTPTGSGWTFATTSGPASYYASDTDVVQLCAQATTSHGVHINCVHVSRSDLTHVIQPIVDATTTLLCELLPPGDYGPVTIDSQGDVYLFGEPFWDCPPYGWR